jgi:capsular polysaccharide biosynthesis protein
MKIFISRRDANTRVLNDEARLVAELEARGFDCPVASELTLESQAELCANAEIIVSTHGAGFANMLYRADRPCKIVEVVPVQRWPFHNVVCMYNLSQVCGFEHYLYDCAYESDETRLLAQNWSVDHAQFLAFIDSLL